MTRSWDDLVLAGQRCETARNWILGDLALEVETSYGERNLQRYADEISVGHDALIKYRYVASRWNSGNRIQNLAWSVHQIFAALDDRAEVIRSRPTWTVAEAREYAEWRRNAVDELLTDVQDATERLRAITRRALDAGLTPAQRTRFTQVVSELQDAATSVGSALLAGDLDAELSQLREGE
jgi:hypothetical protein